MKKLISVMAPFFSAIIYAQDTIPPVMNGAKAPLSTYPADTIPPVIARPDTQWRNQQQDTLRMKRNDGQDKTLNTPAQQMPDDRAMMKDGHMVVIKNGAQMDMPKDIQLNNGTIIKTNGTVKMASGKIMVLKDGQFISLKNKLGNAKSPKKS